MANEFGVEIYNVDKDDVLARGILIDSVTLSHIMNGSIQDILADTKAKDNIRDMLVGIPSTGFAKDQLEIILAPNLSYKDWQIGEALAELYIVSKYNCHFPWRSDRDLKNPKASPAGVDLVGFQKLDDKEEKYRFVFAEVKTSAESRWPPQVSHSKYGLQKQITDLRDSQEVQAGVIKYLAYRALNADWKAWFKSALKRYLSSHNKDALIFGVLIRDVDPKNKDLERHANETFEGKSAETLIIFHALYLPKNVISELPEMLQKRCSP